jgi:hypothetical protein
MAVFFTFDRNYRPLARNLDELLFLATLFRKFFKIYFNAPDICRIDRVSCAKFSSGTDFSSENLTQAWAPVVGVPFGMHHCDYQYSVRLVQIH